MTKPSIAMIPSGYKAEKLYSVLPVNRQGDFAVDRASVATRINASGLIEEVAADIPRLNYLDVFKYKNLFTYSENLAVNELIDSNMSDVRCSFSTSNISNPFNGIADIFTDNASAATTHYFKYGLDTLEDNETYTFSFYVKPINLDKIQLTVRTKANTYLGGTYVFSTETASGLTAEKLDNGWVRLSKSQDVLSGGQQPQMQIYSYSEDGTTSSYAGEEKDRFYFGGLQCEKSSSVTNYEYKNTNAVKYTQLQNCPHLLLEPETTNLMIWSEDFGGAGYSATRCTVDDTATTSPSGTITGNKIESTNTNIAYIREVVSSTLNGTYTNSFFVKKGNATHIATGIFSTSGSGDYIRFFIDVENMVFDGSVTTSGTDISLVDRGIINYNDGWHRVWYTFDTAVTTSFDNYIYPQTDGLAFTSTIGEYNYFWGWQLEESSYLSSYIKTEGSTVTRLADVVNGSGNTSLFNSEAGAIYIEMAALADDGLDRRISISDGTTSNGIYIRYNSTSNQIQAVYVNGGVNQCSLTHEVEDVTTYNKILFTYEEDSFELRINGTSVLDDDTSGTVASANTINVMNLTGATGSADMYAKIKDLRVYDGVLTSSEILELMA